MFSYHTPHRGFLGVYEIDSLPRGMDVRAAMLWAATQGDESMLAGLLDLPDAPNVPHTNEYGQTPFSLAAENGHNGVVKMLLNCDDSGVNIPDQGGQTPLGWAALNGHVAVVELLLTLDNVNANSKDIDGMTPLSWAAANGHGKVVELLLQRHDVELYPVDKDGGTPLLLAASGGHEDIVRTFLLWPDPSTHPSPPISRNGSSTILTSFQRYFQQQ